MKIEWAQPLGFLFLILLPAAFAGPLSTGAVVSHGSATFAETSFQDYGLIGVVLAIVFGIMGRAASAPPVQKFDSRLLRYGTPFKIIMVFSALGLGAFGIGAAHSLKNAPLTGGALFAVCLWAMSYLLLEAYTVHVEFNDDYLRVHSAWRGARQVNWSEIHAYTFSATNYWHIFQTKKYGPIRISGWLPGSRALSEKWHAQR